MPSAQQVLAWSFVEDLWEAQVPTGRYRYYGDHQSVCASIRI